MYYKISFFLSFIRLLPHLILYNIHRNKKIIQYDTQRWLTILNIKGNLQIGFIRLMTYFPEYRNLFYHRIGTAGSIKIICFFCPKISTLHIMTRNIGPGLFIQHGFATVIAAKSIGKDCWINQQVTIGFSNSTDSPTLLDNVVVYAGAKIIGKVKIGNNSIIGANAVVVKSIPDNCTVVGVPAYIVKRNGIKVEQKL